jgi:DNA-binding FrmR family transcriptional regulator
LGEEFPLNQERQKIINRFRRIEGQIRGIEKLVEDEAPCLDILTQVSAVTGAVKKAGTEVIRIYLDRCLAETSGKTEKEREKKMAEFQKALSRYIDMA